MPKKIYIIEAKLSAEKIKYVTEILDQKSKEYKRVPACNIADYIVTELKSPSRIIRNVKKSTCPVVHLNWLIESLKSEKPLNVKDYLIDVTEERKKASLDLSRRVDVNALPQQLTWEEVAERRLNKSNHILGGKDSLIENSALQERSLFMKSYGGRCKPTSSQPIYNLSLNRTQTLVSDSCTQPTFPSASVSSTYINQSSTTLETKVRFPMTTKEINVSSSFTASSSSNCKVVKKEDVSRKRHCPDVVVIEDKEESKASEHDFSIVDTNNSPLLVKESCHTSRNSQQSCSVKEIKSDESNSVQDSSFSSISSMDSQFSITKILSL